MATASSSQTRNKLPETMVVYVYIVIDIYLINQSLPLVFLWFLHVASCFFPANPHHQDQLLAAVAAARRKREEADWHLVCEVVAGWWSMCLYGNYWVNINPNISKYYGNKFEISHIIHDMSMLNRLMILSKYYVYIMCLRGGWHDFSASVIGFSWMVNWI